MTVGGTWGKFLHIDLSSGRQWVETPPDELYLKLVGGRALVAYLLLRDLPAHSDPLGPDNLLIFAPGILQGSNLPGSGRHGVGAKSPLTGAIASGEAGGWWGHEFKRAGFDALIVHGQSQSPVYLWIRDGEVEIRPAEHLWGQDTADVEGAIRAELADDRVRVAQCGLAGENLVLFANIMHDINRAAGRGGLGAVMGSKRLKAVAVRGTMNLPVAARRRVSPVAKWLGDNYETLAAWAVKIGTVQGVRNWGRVGALPTLNFRQPMFEERDRITGQLMHETILLERDTCQVCPINCKQVVEYHGQTIDNPYLRPDFFGKLTIDKAYGGPEYETLAGFGSVCGIDDLLAIAKANELCSRWGMDTISLSLTIAFVIECVEKGLLEAEQTGGFLPAWGDAAAMLEAVEMTAHRRGFGDKMALGSKRLAQWIGNGAEALAVEVKGQELPMHEPRLKQALGVGYATAPVGADHQMNMHDTAFTKPGTELERVAEVEEIPPLALTDLGPQKMRLFYHEVNWRHALDCAVICHFHPYRYSHLAEALSGVSGYEYDIHEVLRVGERAQTLSRLFNLRQGFSAEDDRLPRRVMQAFAEGPLAGVEINEDAFLNARQTWYELMGWTPAGEPTPERLDALGLSSLFLIREGREGREEGEEGEKDSEGEGR
ncbi:MAG: aldehyde ferredoxin oxidoreductase family protein [Caldilineales bacterium]|nr:aldehyde ferredoxin oxidoreductase family protein [Caldilineales bacterium]MCW5860792.1 aldehyde ferredoxin oxidoreductase family protein [Caldilineales bacterium]